VASEYLLLIMQFVVGLNTV